MCLRSGTLHDKFQIHLTGVCFQSRFTRHLRDRTNNIHEIRQYTNSARAYTVMQCVLVPCYVGGGRVTNPASKDLDLISEGLFQRSDM